jgi:hypothetical protein
MTNIISIAFCFFILISCLDKNSISDKLTIYGDSIVGSKTLKKGWAIKLDKNGGFEYLVVGSGPNTQKVYINDLGLIDQIETYKDSRNESYIQFFPNGQLKKIKWKDLRKPFVNNQGISFSKSDSRNIVINANSSNVPIVMGLKDTFEINSDYQIVFRDIFFGDGPTKYQVDTLLFKSPGLKTEMPTDKSSISVSTSKTGNYRLTAKIKTTFLPTPGQSNYTENGTFFKIDLDLIFR